MNTYSVLYWPVGQTAAANTATVQAYTFMIKDGFIVFITNQDVPLFAVPVALNPVVTQTAAG